MNRTTIGQDDPRVPRSYEEALKRKSYKYYPLESAEKCHRHGPDIIVAAWPESMGGGAIFGSQSYRYTKTRIWFCCANEDSMTAYNEAMKNNEPTDPSTAFKLGLDYYWRMERQKHCGHVGKMTLDGKCYTCRHAENMSPRQIAIRAGEAWYNPAPDDPCSNGHLAPRRVNNSSCRQCEEDRKQQRVLDLPDLYPDMVIDRPIAKANGFKFYRTGQPCGQGHTGWRYTSTGNCIECRKGV